MTWIGVAIAGISAAANIGMQASRGGGGASSTGAVMGGVNGLLSGLMGASQGGPISMAASSELTPPATPPIDIAGGFAPPMPAAYSPSQGAPGTSPWSYQPASTGITAEGAPPGAWQYQPASVVGGAQPTMAPAMIGGGTGAGMYGAPPGVPNPQAPNPYMAAIGAAAPALSNVLAARIAQQRPQVMTQRTYNVPAATAPVTVGGSGAAQPPPRLSPLQRYQMMLAGMR